jgi:hypothetical protein
VAEVGFDSLEGLLKCLSALVELTCQTREETMGALARPRQRSARDIDFAQRNMSVRRSIVYGAVGPCKTESSQKPVPIPPILANALLQWKKGIGYTYRADLRSRG